MLSTDPLFYVCAFVVFILFYSFRSPLGQTLILTAGSFAMYAAEGFSFLLLLIANSAFTAVCSFMAATYPPRRARTAMIAGVATNLAVLVLFKYKEMLFAPYGQPDVPWVRDLLAFGLPIGISFYTFHGVSLVVDAWRDPGVLRHRASFSRHGLDTALYLAFFPQLVAGPITKGKVFFPQIVAKRFADIPWASASSNIIVGLFLKRVIADNLNQLTTPLTDARSYPGTPQVELIAMVVGYSAQIFADFAGYSLIAIGIAQVFGYRLPDNFNQPYLAQSITEFWRRWHMSLSAWLREYLYIPLGGNRRGRARTYLNLLIVMGLGGLWHGADWKFAVWGLWHGGLLAIERMLGIGEPARGRSGVVIALFRIPVTFALVTMGWLLFRLTHLSDVGLLIHQLTGAPWLYVRSTPTGLSNVTTICVLSLVVALFHIPAEPFRAHAGWRAFAREARPYGLGLLVAAILMASGSRYAFIYFQF
jgi:alginate O-acetyltransferase complex protein AlgI